MCCKWKKKRDYSANLNSESLELSKNSPNFFPYLFLISLNFRVRLTLCIIPKRNRGNWQRWERDPSTSHEARARARERLSYFYSHECLMCNPRTDVRTPCYLHPRPRTSRSRDVFCTQVRGEVREKEDKVAHRGGPRRRWSEENDGAGS